MKKGDQTPTQALTLPYRKSRGNDAVKIYNDTGRTCQDWQSRILKNILAVNNDGLWIHTKYGFSVPRRNGKNEIVVMRELYGLKNGERILHTAHRTTISHSAAVRLSGLLDALGYTEVQRMSKEAQKNGEYTKHYAFSKQFGLDFNIQRFGLWVKENLKSAISKNEWEAMRAKKLPGFASHDLFVGIKFGKDGTNVAMSIAAKTDNGKIFVEVIDCRPVREGMCGFYKGAIDEIFGTMTEKAVKEWQKANGLVPDGVIGAKSWGKLNLS